jgi:hypothetical protein
LPSSKIVSTVSGKSPTGVGLSRSVEAAPAAAPTMNNAIWDGATGLNRRHAGGAHSDKAKHRDDLHEDDGHDQHRVPREQSFRPSEPGKEERDVCHVANDEDRQ